MLAKLKANRKTEEVFLVLVFPSVVGFVTQPASRGFGVCDYWDVHRTVTQLPSQTVAFCYCEHRILALSNTRTFIKFRK